MYIRLAFFFYAVLIFNYKLSDVFTNSFISITSLASQVVMLAAIILKIGIAYFPTTR